MKIQIDKEFLKKATTEENEYECPPELEIIRDRLRDMLKNEVKQCTLVTGYRGVGKSSFVDDALEMDNTTKPDLLVVKMNVAAYSDYSKFLKRLIREIYFAFSKQAEHTEADALFKKIKALHIHTFYNVTDYTLYGTQKKRGYRYELETKSESNGVNVVSKIVEMIPESLTMFGIWYETQSALIKTLLSAFYVIAKALAVTIQANAWNEKKTTEENRIEVESLYDDEIAEYQLFKVLGEIESSTKKQIVFVFDEMDKIESEEDLGCLFNDIKPLLLTTHSNFILITGRTLETFFRKSHEMEDAVLPSLFSNKVYIPLSSFGDMEKVWRKFVKEKDILEEELVKKYVNSKIIASKGVMRKFINEIIFDVKWDSANKAYIEIDESDFMDFNNEIMEILKLLVENKESYADERELDEYIYRLYGWVNYVLGSQSVYLESLIKDEPSEEIREQCREFLEALKNKKLLKAGEKEGQYVKPDGIKYREVEEVSIEVTHLANEIMRIFDRIVRIIITLGHWMGYTHVRFADSQANDTQYAEIAISVLDEVFGINITKSEVYYDTISKFLEMYKQFACEGASPEELEKIKFEAQKAERRIGTLVESWIRIGLRQRVRGLYIAENAREFDVGIASNYKCDFIIKSRYDKEVLCAVECRLYRQVMKGMLNSIEEVARSMAHMDAIYRPKKLLFLVFIDKYDEERNERMEIRGKELIMRNEMDGEVCIIDWGHFEEGMERVEHILYNTLDMRF